MPTVPDLEYYPITPYPNMVKVVFSNQPSFLSKFRDTLFSPYAHIVWFPENELNGEQAQQLGKGDRYPGAEVIVTNSLVVLKAFQRYREQHRLCVGFYNILWKDGATLADPGTYIHQCSNDLDLISNPLEDWAVAEHVRELLQKKIACPTS